MNKNKIIKNSFFFLFLCILGLVGAFIWNGDIYFITKYLNFFPVNMTGIINTIERVTILPLSIKILITIILAFLLLALYQVLFGIGKKISQRITFFILLLSLIPFLVLGSYNRQGSDDYDYSQKTHMAVEQSDNVFIDVMEGAWETDVYYYMNWQGLYSSAFLLALQPGIWGERFYSLTTPILLTIFLITTYFFVKTIRRYFCDFKDGNFFWTIIVVTTLIHGLPSAREGLYWYCGAMTYMTFFFLLLLSFSFVVIYLESEEKKVRYIVLSSLLSFVISGGNHVVAFLNIMLLIICCLLGYFRGKKLLVIPLISAVIGFVIMFLAPGTAKRQAVLEKQTIIGTMVASVKELLRLLPEWIDLRWLAFMILCTPFALEIVNAEKKKENRRYYPILFLCCSCIIILGMLCVPYYAMGHFGVGRLKNVIWMTFMMLSFACYTYLLCWLQFCMVKRGRTYRCFSSHNKCHITIFATLVICLFFGREGGEIKAGNMLAAIKEVELTREAVLYAKEKDDRVAQIYNAILEGKDTVELEKISYYPRLLFDGSDISSDKNDWNNISMGRYYGIQIELKQENN